MFFSSVHQCVRLQVGLVDRKRSVQSITRLFSAVCAYEITQSLGSLYGLADIFIYLFFFCMCVRTNDSGKGFAFLSTTLGRLVGADACAGMKLGGNFVK